MEFHIVGDAFEGIKDNQLKAFDTSCEAELGRAAPLEAASLHDAAFYFGRYADHRINERENLRLGMLASDVSRDTVDPTKQIEPRCEWENAWV